MVTFEPATERATPAKNAVRPARAPGGEVKAGEWHLHRARRDVDDAAELLAHHRVDHFLRQLDGHHHVGDDAVDHHLPCELAEIPERRARVVVHQDVGLRTGREQRRLTLRGRDVGLHGNDGGPGRLSQFAGGRFERLAVAAVDHDLAAGLRQRHRAAAPEAAARCADDRLAALDPQFHADLPSGREMSNKMLRLKPVLIRVNLNEILKTLNIKTE